VVTGARSKVYLVLQMPQTGSGPQVGADASWASVLQGSGGLVGVLTGGAGHKAATKAGTGFTYLEDGPLVGA